MGKGERRRERDRKNEQGIDKNWRKLDYHWKRRVLALFSVFSLETLKKWGKEIVFSCLAFQLLLPGSGMQKMERDSSAMGRENVWGEEKHILIINL